MEYKEEGNIYIILVKSYYCSVMSKIYYVLCTQKVELNKQNC